MRIPRVCTRCRHDVSTPVVGFDVPNDDGIFRYSCPNGHESVTVLQEQSFEVLSELAINAILDGYYREAVVSFSSSLERFHGFAIAVLCEAFGTPEAEYVHVQQQVAHLSERQLGGYAQLHLVAFGKAAPLLSSGNTKFRNSVVHGGEIPSLGRALEFGDAVLAAMRPVLDDLLATHQDHVNTVTERMISARYKKAKRSATPGVQVGTMSIDTAISLSRRQPGEPEGVAARVNRLRRDRRLLGLHVADM